MKKFGSFDVALKYITKFMVDYGYQIKTEKWQGIDLKDKPELTMREVLHFSFGVMSTDNELWLLQQIKPNLPWVKVHFKERIGGEPLNPGESYKIWPYYKRDKEMRTEDEKFSHTYMERFWPKFANNPGEGIYKRETGGNPIRKGIRYQYGDLDDLIKLLLKEPHTRQAYLPIWFPEDTGSVHGGRVPCTLGYHFIRRGNNLHITYYIRSCDLVRHLRDDIYLACILLNHIIDKLKEQDKESWNDVKPGWFIMHITSLHCFESDYQLLKKYE